MGGEDVVFAVAGVVDAGEAGEDVAAGEDEDAGKGGEEGGEGEEQARCRGGGRVYRGAGVGVARGGEGPHLWWLVLEEEDRDEEGRWRW